MHRSRVAALAIRKAAQSTFTRNLTHDSNLFPAFIFTYQLQLGIANLSMRLSPFAAEEAGISWTRRCISVQNTCRGPVGTHVTCAAPKGFVIRKRTMRFRAKGGLFFLLLYLAAIRPGVAQRQEEEKQTQVGTNGVDRATRGVPGLQKKVTARLLSPNEGLAILTAALDSRHHNAEFSADCSHFVHELFERAGFPYQYASSSDLYEGRDEFRRVANPQVGDLAVWRGHAGILVNPDQHSFFSVLHSGPGVDSYDSPYWKQRGHPRFFRYIKLAPGGVDTSIRNASWRPIVRNDGDSDEPAAGAPVGDFSDESPSETMPSAKPTKTNWETLPVVILNSARPNSEQVRTAFLQACNDSEQTLRGRDLFNSAQSLLVFDHFEVGKLHITGNRGWIEIHIDELVSLKGGKAEALHKGLERQQWSLRRSGNKSWELNPSRNAIYLPQPIAERVLVHNLAQLTEDNSDSTSENQEKVDLARLLDVLFAK
jgi:NlpC/P60 family